MSLATAEDSVEERKESLQLGLRTKDVRVAMIGNVDSGKSTLVGCLTKCMVDNGRGLARSRVFRHRHETENGRTSSVGVEVMGFAGDDQVPVDLKASRQKAWQTVHVKSDKTLTLIDLCGHEKYLKTTVFGLTGMLPDYGMVVVGANMGISRMTREHIGIAVALKIPLLIVVTKVDICPENVYKKTMSQVSKVLKKANKLPYMLRTLEDIPNAAAGVCGGRITPVFIVSNVSGQGHDLLRSMLRELPPRVTSLTGRAIKRRQSTDATAEAPSTPGEEEAPAPSADACAEPETGALDAPEEAASSAGPCECGQVAIDSVFNVPGVGTVVAGTVLNAPVRTGSTMLLGPDRAGQFVPVIVRSIHVQYTPADIAAPGGSAAFNIKPKTKLKGGGDKRHPWVKKGMALVDPALNPSSNWEFTAEVLILHHQTTLSRGYAPIMHCGVVTQSAKILEITGLKGEATDTLRTGDRAIIRCRWMYRPEFILPGTMLLFREGRAKGVGRVRQVGEAQKPSRQHSA